MTPTFWYGGSLDSPNLEFSQLYTSSWARNSMINLPCPKTSAGQSFRWVLMSTKVSVYLFVFVCSSVITYPLPPWGVPVVIAIKASCLFNGSIFLQYAQPTEKSHCVAFQRRWCLPRPWLSQALMMRSSMGLLLQLHSYLLTSLNYFLLYWTHHFRPLNFPETVLPMEPKASSADKHSVRTALSCSA